MSDNGEAFMPDDRSIAESTSTWGVVNLDINEKTNPTEDLKAPSSKLPWAICMTFFCARVLIPPLMFFLAFESGGLTISCTVLYPEQFDALRRTYDCDKSMIESLARCVKWNASGGKSGSAFLKTRGEWLSLCMGGIADTNPQTIGLLRKSCHALNFRAWKHLPQLTSTICPQRCLQM